MAGRPASATVPLWPGRPARHSRAVGSGGSMVQAARASTSVAQAATTTPSLTITVYRPSLATQYGPGFYGNRTACGERPAEKE